MRWYQQTHWRILVALGCGSVYGVVAALSGWGAFTSDWITPFGTIFLRLLLLIAVPLVLASLITGIASLADLNKLSRIGGKTIVIYLLTTFIALIIGLAVVMVCEPDCRLPTRLTSLIEKPLLKKPLRLAHLNRWLRWSRKTFSGQQPTTERC